MSARSWPACARTRASAVTTGVLLTASVLSAAVLPATAATAVKRPVVSRGVTIPAFYTPPAVLPAGSGRIVRSEPLRLAVRLPGVPGPLPGRATRIMYTSTDALGHRMPVTGAFLEPTVPWRGSGPRPLVVLAPGTLGQGDQCSASLGLEHPLAVGLGTGAGALGLGALGLGALGAATGAATGAGTGMGVGMGATVSAGYENLVIYRFLGHGVAVVVTDYAGLGTTDRLHTYVNRLDEAHAVLDAARAVRGLGPARSVSAASPVGLYGYSQGGGATAAAAELQPAYAPDVRLAGTYAGAPPADLAQVIAGIDGSDLAGAVGWSLNGFVQTYPAVRPVLARHINARGEAALRDLTTMCIGDAILAYGSQRTSNWTTDGRTLSQIIPTEPVARSVIAQQLIGTRRPAGPVRVATSVSDNLVPHAQARALAVRWCGLGGRITYVPLRLPPLGRALFNHAAGYLADQGDAVAWLTDRLSGRPAVSTCATLPGQP